MQYVLGNVLATKVQNSLNPLNVPGLVAGYNVNNTIRTGSSIDTWSDVSGNGYNATFVTTKDTVTVDAINGDYASGGGIYLPSTPIPATFSNMTQIVVFRSNRITAGNALQNITPLLTNPAASGGGFLVTSGTAQFYNPQINIGCIRNPANQNNVITIRWTPSSRSFRSNRIQNSGSANGSAAVTSFAHIWGYAGSGSFKWATERVGMYIYNRALSDSEVTLIENFYKTTKPSSALHVIGDSFVAGVGASTGNNAYCRLIESSTGLSACVHGSSGAILSTFTASVLATSIASSVNAGLSTKVVLDLGKNNLAANTSSSTLQTQFTTFVNSITSAGADLIVLSIPPRTSGFSGGATSASYETERLSFNSWLRTQEGTLFERLADVGAASGLGSVSDLSGPNYSGDDIHLSDAGHLLYSQVVKTEIDSLP
jgi:hypothetical protein